MIQKRFQERLTLEKERLELLKFRRIEYRKWTMRGLGMFAAGLVVNELIKYLGVHSILLALGGFVLALAGLLLFFRGIFNSDLSAVDAFSDKIGYHTISMQISDAEEQIRILERKIDMNEKRFEGINRPEENEPDLYNPSCDLMGDEVRKILEKPVQVKGSASGGYIREQSPANNNAVNILLAEQSLGKGGNADILPIGQFAGEVGNAGILAGGQFTEEVGNAGILPEGQFVGEGWSVDIFPGGQFAGEGGNAGILSGEQSFGESGNAGILLEGQSAGEGGIIAFAEGQGGSAGLPSGEAGEKTLEEFAAPYYADKDIMHNMWHLRLVEKQVEKIIELGHYEVNREFLRLAMYFHGFVYRDEKNVREWLRANHYEPKDINRIIRISLESQRGEEPETLEGKILHDAHVLEGGETYTVVKTLITGSVRGQSLEQTLEYMKKEVLGKNRCYLPETIPMCEEMNEFTQQFYEKLSRGIR